MVRSLARRGRIFVDGAANPNPGQGSRMKGPPRHTTRAVSRTRAGAGGSASGRHASTLLAAPRLAQRDVP